MAGFLDNGSIIIDAVLTDVGRQILARNDGSFSISKFALGDDEINYSIIEKYGQTVGEQKIKLNTPVLEAITNQSQAQKYKLISISNQKLTRYPEIELVGTPENLNTSTGLVTLISNSNVGSQRRSAITLEQVINSGNSILGELVDVEFQIQLNDNFLSLQEVTQPDSIDTNRIATYSVERTQNTNGTTNTSGGSKVTFTLITKTITDTQFALYGNFSNKNIITTRVRVTGMNSGATKEIVVQINRLTS
jgi:hypothetical protein